MAIQDQFDHMITSQGGHSAEDALLLPNVTGWRPAAAGGTNQGYLIELEGGDEAYFKPLNGIQPSGRTAISTDSSIGGATRGRSLARRP